ncbi:MAG: tetratricopeptide repeat protein [Halioglobus sp.]|nr:tetratricopeptide repeat protein [Halioglobus sp.]
MTQYADKSQHPDALARHRAACADGRSHYSERDFARASRDFETALEYQPEDPLAWFALGNCHDAMNSPARAEVCYRMSLKYAAPEAVADVYYNLGNSLFDQQKYQLALDCYARVGEQSKAFAAAQKNMLLARKALS